MKAISHLGLVLIIYFLLPVKPVDSLYFHMKYTGKRCFIQEIPDDTMVSGKFKVERAIWNTTVGGYDQLHFPPTIKLNRTLNPHGIGLVIDVKDPSGSFVLSKSYGMEGRFTFTSATHGEHVICLAPNITENPDVPPPSSLEVARINLDLEKGGMAIDYEIVKQKEKLTSIQLRVRKLLDLIDQITKEQYYQRQREMRFRQTSESTNRRVLFFATLQTVMVVALGYYQVINLKEFFRQKKLV